MKRVAVVRCGCGHWARSAPCAICERERRGSTRQAARAARLRALVQSGHHPARSALATLEPQ